MRISLFFLFVIMEATKPILNYSEKGLLNIYLIQPEEEGLVHIFWKNVERAVFIRKIELSASVEEIRELVKTDAGVERFEFEYNSGRILCRIG